MGIKSYKSGFHRKANCILLYTDGMYYIYSIYLFVGVNTFTWNMKNTQKNGKLVKNPLPIRESAYNAQPPVESIKKIKK